MRDVEAEQAILSNYDATQDLHKKAKRTTMEMDRLAKDNDALVKERDDTITDWDLAETRPERNERDHILAQTKVSKGVHGPGDMTNSKRATSAVSIPRAQGGWISGAPTGPRHPRERSQRQAVAPTQNARNDTNLTTDALAKPKDLLYDSRYATR